jgi:hypothetical protein
LNKKLQQFFPQASPIRHECIALPVSSVSALPLSALFSFPFPPMPPAHRASPVLDVSRKTLYEQLTTAQLLLWNNWLGRRAGHAGRDTDIIERKISDAWESLEKLRDAEAEEPRAIVLWQEVEQAVSGVRRALAA